VQILWHYAIPIAFAAFILEALWHLS